LLEDLGDAANDPQRKDMLAKVQAASYDQIVKDPKMMEFVRSVGKGCSATTARPVTVAAAKAWSACIRT
jgi:hypothetical protein